MIESIKIRDFRGIKNGTIEGFRKINLLVGPNNSGKSAVLEALYLSCTASHPAGMTDEQDKTTPYEIMVTDKDLLGDHPMQRVWGKHGYGLQQYGLGEWDAGQIKVHQKNRETRLPDFSLSLEELFSQGDERFTAVFGLESQDRTQQSYENQLEKIQQHIVTLKQELETPFGEGIAGTGEEQERRRDQEIEKINKEIEAKESEKGDLEEAEEIRGERIKFLADQLMGYGLPGFSQSRLIYCWDSSLSHGYKGDAVWIIKGEQIPTAKQVILYDLSKVTGYIPLEFVREYFLQEPEPLQKLTESFRRVFRLKRCAIQFQPASEDRTLSQAWVSADEQVYVPIDAFGDGARSVLKLLAALHTLVDSVGDKEPEESSEPKRTKEPTPGLLIWEEPELFQNPQTLGPLLREVVKLVRPKPIQVFIASHSMEVPAHFVRLVRRKQLNEDELIVIKTRLYEDKLLSAQFDRRNVEASIRMKRDLRTPTGEADSPLVYQIQEEDDE